MKDIDIAKVSNLCDDLNKKVGFNQIETELLINNLERYCYITRSIPIFRNNYIDVILDLISAEAIIETRESNIRVDFIFLKKLNQIFDLVEEYNEFIEEF